MTGAPLAHLAGIPIEETLAALGPGLLAGLAVAWAKLRVRLRSVRSRATKHTARARLGTHGAGGSA